MLSKPTVARRLAGCCLVGLFALSPSRAEMPAAGGATEDLPDIEVTVQRIRQAKEDVAVPVTVITPDELPVATGASVADALRTVPGFDRRPAGSDGAIEGFSLRGAKAEQVLVLIDGRRVGTAQGGGVNLGDLPLADVERIEVLRGGASALYGSDPIGGVINIVTKRGGQGLEATLRGGSFGAIGAQASAGGSRGRAAWRWNAEYYNQDGGFTYRTTTGAWASRTNNRLLRRGLDAKGNPTWDLTEPRTWPKPAEFAQLRRLRYDSATDTMILGGTTTEHRNQHWKPMGPVMVRYDKWSSATPTRRWTLVAPYDNGAQGHFSCEPMGFDTAGDYLFVPYTGESKTLGYAYGHVEVFRLDDASPVGHMEPSPEIGQIGLQDLRETLSATRRTDGEYVVFLEDDYKSKTVMYRWKP